MYDVSERIAFDVGYRFFSIGQADVSYTVTPPFGPPSTATAAQQFTASELLFGLRVYHNAGRSEHLRSDGASCSGSGSQSPRRGEALAGGATAKAIDEAGGDFGQGHRVVGPARLDHRLRHAVDDTGTGCLGDDEPPV